MQTEAWLDQDDAHTVATIRRHGWLITYVHSSGIRRPGGREVPGPPFAYTVGLFGLHHPELLIVGMSPNASATILNRLGNRIKAGETLLPGTMVEVEDWDGRMMPEPVPNPGEIVFAANRYYRRPANQSVPVLQLSYEDEAGRFPWEPGYATPQQQPRPGTLLA
jgi:hypothetical protein